MTKTNNSNLNNSSSVTQYGNSKTSFVQSILLAVVIAVLVRSFIVEPFRIPSGSMKPNLMIGDYIFVSRFSYGFSKYSFPIPLEFIEGRILEFSTPQRGDVVIFKIPKHNKIYVKRLIGLPGDVVQLQNSKLYINSVPIAREYVDEFNDPDNHSVLHHYIEKLPDGFSYHVLNDGNNDKWENTDAYVVPPEHYFFMGDNRDNSRDGRDLEYMGFIPEENIIGKAQLVFFSTQAKWWEFWRWFTAMDYNRFLKLVK